MAQVFTVTAGTSIVSVSTLTSPNTVVLLSSIAYPGHIVGIRDTTGSPSIAVTPIIVSTTNGVKFYDGTTSSIINQPNGQLSVSSRNPTTWQILNNAAYFTTLSNAYLEQLTANYGYASLVSSVSEQLSTLQVNKINVSRSIFVSGKAVIQGDVSVAGGLTIFSTLQIVKDMNISSALTVGGFVNAFSSIVIGDTLTLGKSLSTGQNFIVGKNLYVQSSIGFEAAILAKALSIQTMIVSTLNVGGGVNAYGNVSTQSNLATGGKLLVSGKALIEDAIFVGGSANIGGNAYFGGNLTAGIIANQGNAFIEENVSINSNLGVTGAVSSIADVIVGWSTIAGLPTQILVHGDAYVNTITASTTTIHGSAEYTSISSGVVTVGNDVSLDRYLKSQNLRVQSNVSVKEDIKLINLLNISTNLSTQSNLYVGGNLIFTSTLFIPGSSYVGGSLLNISSLSAQSNVSTTQLAAFRNLTVLGNMSVIKKAYAETLGAPISLTTGYLSVYSTLFVRSQASIPYLITQTFPFKTATTDYPTLPFDLNIGGSIYVSSLTTRSTNSLYTMNTLEAKQIFNTRPSTVSYVGNPFINETQYVPNPLYGIQGFLVGGAPSTTTSSIVYSRFADTFYQAKGGLTQETNKILYNGSNRWVAVGAGASTILYSDDGYNWSNAIGAFTSNVTALAYGNGTWVAGSRQAPYVKYSYDGVTWSNGSKVTIDQGVSNVAYQSNLWVAVGTTSIPYLGVNTSPNGVVWDVPSTLLLPGTSGSSCTAVAYLNPPQVTPYWLVATQDAALYGTTDGSTWINTTLSQHPLFSNMYWFNDQYYSGTYAAATRASSGSFANPTWAISRLAPNGNSWQPVFGTDLSGSAVRDLTVRSNTMYAVTDHGVLYTMFSTSGTWVNRGYIDSLSSANTIAQGPLVVPDPVGFFKFNVPSYFSSVVSSIFMTANTIQAPLFSGALIGSGNALSNVDKFTPFIFTSTFISDRLYASERVQNTDIYDSNIPRTNLEFFKISTTQVDGSIYISTSAFQSTTVVTLAGGIDAISSALIKTSANGKDWQGVGNDTFQYLVTGITGNLDKFNTTYVATGGDGNPLKTIQYSRDGQSWTPITIGGFSNTNSLGYYQANAVAYSPSLLTWVAGGIDRMSNRTIYYALDPYTPSVWFPASNAYSNTCFYLANGNNMLLALGESFLPPGYCNTNVKYTTVPGLWSNLRDATTDVVLDVITYHYYQASGNRDYWVGYSNLDLYTLSFVNSTYETVTKNTNALNSKANALYYNGDYFVAVGSNTIQYTRNPQSFLNATNTVTGNSTFPVEFKSIYYNQLKDLWIAGATTFTSSYTLWYSPNVKDWYPSITGGFTTKFLNPGIGFAAFTISTGQVLLGGTGAFAELTPSQPQLLRAVDLGGPQKETTVVLQQSNAPNVFSTTIRAIAYSELEDFNVVAVGDGVVPSRTIGRFNYYANNTFSPMLPATSGGFKEGFGVAYFISSIYSNWIATGDSLFSTNTIQYSADGANWFGANTSGQGLRDGGRGIAVGFSTLSSVAVAVGKDVLSPSRIVYTTNGFNWISSATTTFSNASITSPEAYGIGVTAGLRYIGPSVSLPVFLTVGKSDVSNNTILFSYDGSNWTNTAGSNGFTSQGNAIAYHYDSVSDKHTYLAVGETSSNQSTSVLYSVDGGVNWAAVGPSIPAKWYGVSYWNSMSQWVITGSVGNESKYSVLFSANPLTSVDPTLGAWTPLADNTFGFKAVQQYGSANAIYAQERQTNERYPILSMSNFSIYERSNAFNLANATMRVGNSNLAILENTFLNFSTQMTIGTQTPYTPSTTLTVAGYAYASSIFYALNDNTTVPKKMIASNVLASTIFEADYTILTTLHTPDLAIVSPFSPSTYMEKANRIDLGYNQVQYKSNLFVSTQRVAVNNTLTTFQTYGLTGIRVSSPGYSLDVSGTSAVSSFITASMTTRDLILTSTAQRIYMSSPTLTMVTDIGSQITSNNTIFTGPSSMNFNSVLSLNISTQNVGCYTRTPQFDLDVRRLGILDVGATRHVQSGAFYVTLFSV